MYFSLIVVSNSSNGKVSGSYLQSKFGTLESVSKFARDTESVNSNAIDVAVVAGMPGYFPIGNLVYEASRLDIY